MKDKCKLCLMPLKVCLQAYFTMVRIFAAGSFRYPAQPDSAETFHGDRCGGWHTWIADNGMMRILEMPGYQKEDASALNRAGCSRPDYQNGDPITVRCIREGGGDVGSIGYPQGWHGYLRRCAAFLMVTDYLGIRSINTVFLRYNIITGVGYDKKKTISLSLPLGITIYFCVH